MSIRSICFESVNRKVRAYQLRTDGRANHVAGYPGLAEVCFEMAELLDPTPREVAPPTKNRRQHTDGATTGRASTGRLVGHDSGGAVVHAGNNKALVGYVKGSERGSHGGNHRGSGVAGNRRSAADMGRTASTRPSPATTLAGRTRRPGGAPMARDAQ